MKLKNGIYDFSEATLENAIELTKSLMKKYDIKIDRVIRHFDVNGKPCPKPFVDNNRWKEFKNRLHAYFFCYLFITIKDGIL